MPWIKDNGDGTFQYSRHKPSGDLSGWSNKPESDPDVQKAMDPCAHDLTAFVNEVRVERNIRLEKSDAYKLDDFPLGSVTSEQVNTYRQALRDFPSTIASVPEDGMDGLTWPTDPLE